MQSRECGPTVLFIYKSNASVISGPRVVGGAGKVADVCGCRFPFDTTAHLFGIGCDNEQRFSFRNLSGDVGKALFYLIEHFSPVGIGVRPSELYARLRIPFGRQDIVGVFHLFSLGLRSKNGFLEEALIGMAMHCRQSFSRPNFSTAHPAENMTLQSTLKSAALAQAEPMAIPTSMELMAHGVDQWLLCTSGKAAIGTIETLWRLTCSNDNHGIGQLNVFTVSDEKLHAGFFGQS